MKSSNQCPRCGVGLLRRWSELSDEEREVVRRLPAAVEFSLEERKAIHRWCTRCWCEIMSDQPHEA